MRLVVSTDDGPDAPGFLALFSAAQQIVGSTVYPAPSESRRSNTGTALSDRGLTTCAGCVRESIVAQATDLVAIGLNYGPNIGPAMVHSGTIGGALTALSLGCPAVAISVDDVHSSGHDNRIQWEVAASIAQVALAWVLEAEPGIVAVSINVPNVPLHSVEGAVAPRLSTPPHGREVEAGILATNMVSLIDLRFPSGPPIVACSSSVAERLSAHLNAALLTS